jgi:subtilisin family serine protease
MSIRASRVQGANTPARSVRLTAAAIAMFAGSSVALAAADGQIALSRAGLQTRLVVGGIAIRTTQAAVFNQRLYTFAGSPMVAASWDELAAGGTVSYWAVAPDGKTWTDPHIHGNTVRLRYAEFDPARGEPAVPAGLRAGAGNELFLVQFRTSPLAEMQAELAAAGARVERFMPDHTLVVRMNQAGRAAVSQLPYIRWVGAYHPAYRLDEQVRADLLGSPSIARRYSIECLERGMGQQQLVADAVVKAGGIVEVHTPDQFRMEATITAAQLLQILRGNEINWIDPWQGPGGTDMDIARQIGGGIMLAGLGYTGQGVRGEVFDTEVRVTHQAFQNPGPLLHGGSAGSASNAHGSACYGINFAKWPAQPNATGMLPDREQGIYCNYALSTQFSGATSRLTFNQQLVDPSGPYRAVFQTSSVGSTLTTLYTSISAEVDDYLLRTALLSCQSQSNAGSTSSRPQAWAKNIVSVGGITHNNTLTRTDDSWTSASFGPATDGRVKPDLAHFYDNIFTTWNSSDTATTQFSGTSGATPITAGHFGLLFQLVHEGVFAGFGGGSSVFEDRVHMTLAKAMMINTAYRYAWTGAGSNPSLTRAKQGWGMADLANLYNLRNKMLLVDATDPLTTGQSRVYQVTVAPSEPALNVTMSFPEPMGSTSSSQARINNLSLRVTSPTAVVYWGNVGLTASNFSTPGGSENMVDPVENVFVQNPAAGTWTVEVLATEVVGDAYLADTTINAPFALVVTGAVPANPAPACYANCDGSTQDPVLSILDLNCFLNRFAAGDTYANCDGSLVPPVLNVLDFNCFLNKFAAGCSAP